MISKVHPHPNSFTLPHSRSRWQRRPAIFSYKSAPKSIGAQIRIGSPSDNNKETQDTLRSVFTDFLRISWFISGQLLPFHLHSISTSTSFHFTHWAHFANSVRFIFHFVWDSTLLSTIELCSPHNINLHLRGQRGYMVRGPASVTDNYPRTTRGC